MKTNVILFLTIYLMMSFVIEESSAKTFAYLVGTDARVTKIDTDTDAIVSTKDLSNAESYVQSDEMSVAADSINKHLFVVAGRKGSKVLVYDLKELSFIRDMGISTPDPDITVFPTPDGKKILIVWWNPQLEEGAWQFDVFDGVTFEKIKTLDFYFHPKEVTFSKDCSKLYAIEGGDWARVKVIDMTVLSISSTIDLNSIWQHAGYMSGIEDYKNEKVVIRETKKVDVESAPEISYFVYDFGSKFTSARILTIVAGNTKLSPDGTKLFISDENAVWSSDKKRVMYHKSVGKLYVYDILTAKEVGVIPFTVDRESNILGVHPNGNKLYMKGDISGVRSLIVMDAITFNVVKTLQIPAPVQFMVFFDEPDSGSSGTVQP